MFPDLEFIKTCLNGLRSQIERVENWVVSFVRTNHPNWAQNDPNALDYIKGRTHYEVNGRVVQLPSKFLPSPTSNAVGAIKADSAKTTDIQPVRLGTDGKLYSSGIPIFTTSGTGSAYTANVPEITELVNGMLVVMIPHAASGSTAPTLNINGLGAHQIRRFKSSGTSAINSPTGIYSNWLKSDVPVILMYNSGFWYACSFTKPDVSDLWGTIPVSKGGTNRTTLTKGSYLVGNGTGSVLLKTPSEVLADIGAIPAPATAEVGQVLVVKAVDENDKPTEWETADMPSGTGSDIEIIASETLTESAATVEFTGLNLGVGSYTIIIRNTGKLTGTGLSISLNGITKSGYTGGFYADNGITSANISVLGSYTLCMGCMSNGGKNKYMWDSVTLTITSISVFSPYHLTDETKYFSAGTIVEIYRGVINYNM